MTIPTHPKSSNAPFVLSALAFVTCLFPLGLIGAWLGHRQAGRARAANRPPRWQSRAAVVLGLLSLIDTVALGAWMRHSQSVKMAQVDSALARVASAREEATLTKETACALAEAFLVARAVDGAAVTCAGALVATGTAASLPGVSIASQPPVTYTACLARRRRWFVTAAIESGRCPDVPADVAEGPTIEATERAIQQAVAGSARRAELDALLAPLAVVRPALGKPAGSPQCPDIRTASLTVVDSAALPADPGAPPPDAAWTFLTSKAAWRAMDPAETPRVRHDAATEAFGADQRYLLVVDGTARVAPQALEKGFRGGSFAGRLALVDLTTASVLCESPLAFRSSQSVKTGGGVNVGYRLLPKVNIGGKDISKALDQDFRESYTRALSKALDQMTSGRVKPVL